MDKDKARAALEHFPATPTELASQNEIYTWFQLNEQEIRSALQFIIEGGDGVRVIVPREADAHMLLELTKIMIGTKMQDAYKAMIEAHTRGNGTGE